MRDNTGLKIFTELTRSEAMVSNHLPGLLLLDFSALFRTRQFS